MESGEFRRQRFQEPIIRYNSLGMAQTRKAGSTTGKELERNPSIEPPSIVAVTVVVVVIDSVAAQMVGSPN
jgi:hypothetical protein